MDEGRTRQFPQHSDLVALTCEGSCEDKMDFKQKAPGRELGTR